MADEYNDYPKRSISKNATETVRLPSKLRLKAQAFSGRPETTIRSDGFSVTGRSR